VTVRYPAYVLALVLAFSFSALAADDGDDKRLRAKKPTVVTVEGKLDPVLADREPQRRSLGAKIIGGVQTGALKTWSGLIDFTGWILNVDDDIPSKRQRLEPSTQQQEKQR
jgi:hypothetical protein